jgi:hypothetical protein
MSAISAITVPVSTSQSVAGGSYKRIESIEECYDHGYATAQQQSPQPPQRHLQLVYPLLE